MVVFLFNTVIYVFLLLGLCILIVWLPWLRFFHAFSSVVRQMPGYNSPRRGTARTFPKFLCRSVYCLGVNMYCTLLLPLGGNPIAVNKYIISYQIMEQSLSIRPSPWNNSAPTGRIFMKFDIWVFFENLLSKFKCLNSNKSDGYLTWRVPYMTGALHDRCLTWRVPYMTGTLHDGYLTWPIPYTTGTLHDGYLTWRVPYVKPNVHLWYFTRFFLILETFQTEFIAKIKILFVLNNLFFSKIVPFMR